MIPSPFWLGQDEITRSQWSGVMAAKGESNDPNLPKTGVSYGEVLDFVARLNAREAAARRLPKDHHYALPTESEWEYACRAGTQTPFFPGDRLSPEQANFNSLYPYGGAIPLRAADAPLPVGNFPSNAWGFRDMHGNVWEWCRNDPARSALDPSTAPGPTGEHIARGGAWSSPAHRCRSSARLALDATTHSPHLGFRIALVPVDATPASDAASAPSVLVQP